jgi:para-nitrobenzyl esterase
MNERRPVVATGSGRVRGVWDQGVAAFRGIEYAATPTGALRLAPPQPRPDWDGVRDAAHAGPAVPQGPSRLASIMGDRAPDWAEDGCLNVNVWTPAAALAGEPKPVLLWWHGGGFTSGSGGWDWYDGARLAALGDIVVVTANYRLGPLGYLYLPEIGADNVGVQDQAAALRWVADDIAGFGGDPARITVGGQSAGAFSALALAVAPGTGDLVHAVLGQSGPWGLAPQPADAASDTADAYLGLLGIDRAGDPGARLRAVPAADLVAAYRELSVARAVVDSIAPPLYPVLGGAGIPRALTDAVRAGALAGKPVLLGAATDELTAFGFTGADLAAGNQRWMLDPLAEIAGSATDRGSAAYVYEFARRPGPDPRGLGATHCAELPFLFGTFDSYPDAAMLGPVTEADHALFRSFAGAVAAFVTTGSPGWDAYPTVPAHRFGN